MTTSTSQEGSAAAITPTVDTYRVEYDSGRTVTVEASSADEAIDNGRRFIHWSGSIPTHHEDTSEAWAVYSLTEYPDPA